MSFSKSIKYLLLLALVVDVCFLNYRLFSLPKKEEPLLESLVGITPTPPVAVATSCPVVTFIPTPTMPLTKVSREYYIPLGSGSTKSSDWEDLNGVEAVIDMNNYPNPKSIIFETSMYIPTGNGEVKAKLYNVTDQHDAWSSEVTSSGSTSQRNEANNISLAPGRKLYRVMMKSSMSYPAILDSARLKIILEEVR